MEIEQSGKRDAERYLVVTRIGSVNVWATSFANVLKEIKESFKIGEAEIKDDDVIALIKLDV